MKLRILTLLLLLSLISCNENIPINNEWLKTQDSALYNFIDPNIVISGYHNIDNDKIESKYSNTHKEPFWYIDSIIKLDNWIVNKSNSRERVLSKNGQTLLITHDITTNEITFISN